MVNANDFCGKNDNETLERAIANRQADGIVQIPPRVSEIDPERDFWLLDRAILLPENTVIVLQNCKLKLSDRCRDNFFRTANCGLGIEEVEPIRNVHIRGEGVCVLEGAEHPRATGDGSKILACPCPYLPEDICRLADWVPEERRTVEKLDFWDRHDHSYGTDALDENESHYGDWRGIGILIANAEDFSISNLRLVKTHGWGISMEACGHGRVEKIDFASNMSKEIDGMLNNMENQDGINLRNGCHDIIVSDITGQTGDDVVALTAIAEPRPYRPGGSLRSTHVMHNDWSRREGGIRNVILRNIVANSELCLSVRLLSCNTKIQNVVIDGVIDNTPDGHPHSATLEIGCNDGAYGKNLPDGASNITISNIICNGNKAIRVGGYLKDSTICNVINKNPDCPAIYVIRENGLNNVITSNIFSASGVIIESENRKQDM